MATIVGIFISPAKGQPMQALPRVEAIAHVGLQGDRYALDKGSYSFAINRRFQSENINADRPIRHVTLISRSALDDANKRLSVPFLPIETRRNLLIDYISAADLLGLVDRVFTIGPVQMRGFEDCVPCAIPGHMAAKPGFREALATCAGLRAEILTSGKVEIGDEVGLPYPLAEKDGSPPKSLIERPQPHRKWCF